jgi:hypothetical protein
MTYLPQLTLQETSSKQCRSPSSHIIGSLAALAAKYLKFFKLLAQAIVNMTNSDEQENTIASNLLSLASLDWIIANVHFIAVITKKWLNPHMRWYLRSDPNIG